MTVKIHTASLLGIEGSIISVEVDISNGLPCFNIVGLADTSVKESKERVRAAIVNSGYDFPVSKITINLAPADLKKEGSHFDLPIAIGIMIATNQIKFSEHDNFIFVGELSLDGSLKKVRGALPIVLEGLKNNINNYIVPDDNAQECCVVKTSQIYPFNNLKQVSEFLVNRDMMPFDSRESYSTHDNSEYDYEDVIGQDSAKRAVEIAAAGGHNIIMFGPPGSGKTMIAYRIPSILPQLSYEEALEVTKIYSVSGNLKNEGLIRWRPFRNPHHTCSDIALIGGGKNLIPGEISLAHNGVLFMDELLEFKRHVLEVLRQPLEDRVIKVSRASGSTSYPANFMLVGALNPCPCGFYASNVKQCRCTDYERRRYLGRLSGPLLDRIDMFTFISSLNYTQISSNNKSESSKEIKARVENARELQRLRFIKDKILCNSQMNQKQINKYCKLKGSSMKLMEKIYEKYNISNRAFNRILKLSRTISDLSGREVIEDCDVIEAIQYRKFIDETII